MHPPGIPTPFLRQNARRRTLNHRAKPRCFGADRHRTALLTLIYLNRMAALCGKVTTDAVAMLQCIVGVSMCETPGHASKCNCFDRRNFFRMAAAAGTVGMAGGTLLLPNEARADALTKAQREKMTPDQIIQTMKKGNERFRRGERKDRNYLREQRASASGQFPAAALLSCIDSRAPAEVIMDLGIGDIFNSRVAGNIENPRLRRWIEEAP